jgi:glycosyltransferase involved in cell wall biosynthesis
VLGLNPGGTERLVVELAARLNAEIPMMVCCLDDAGEWAAELETRGVAVTALQRKPGFRPGLGRAVAGAVRRHNATVVHAHHYSPFVYSCLARLGRPAVQVVFTEHGRLSDAPPSRKRRIANHALARCPRRVFAVSDNLRAHLVGEGFSPGAVGVIYNGIDVGPLPDAVSRMRVRERLSAPRDAIVIGTIARLDPVKDLGTLIRATARIAAQLPVVVAVIGDGSERQRLEKLASDLGVGTQVRFLGHREDARDWLAGCDVYVNCSISEGVSLTILEAMAAGLPVVATRVGGTPEVVDDSCGWLIPARDPEGLAAALVDLAREPARRQALGRAARARVETEFTLDRMVSEYKRVYLESGPPHESPVRPPRVPTVSNV